MPKEKRMKWLIEMIFVVTNQGKAVSMRERMVLEENINARFTAFTLLLSFVFGMLACFQGIETYCEWLVASGLLSLSFIATFFMYRVKPERGYNALHSASMIIFVGFACYAGIQLVRVIIRFLGG